MNVGLFLQRSIASPLLPFFPPAAIEGTISRSRPQPTSRTAEDSTSLEYDGDFSRFARSLRDVRGLSSISK